MKKVNILLPFCKWKKKKSEAKDWVAYARSATQLSQELNSGCKARVLSTWLCSPTYVKASG